MGRNDFGRTPNVWQPAEVPPPFTGHDIGVGPAPTYGPVTTTTVTEYGYPPVSTTGWRLLLDRSPGLMKTNGTFEFDRFDIDPSIVALQVVSIWRYRNLDNVGQPVTVSIRALPGTGLSPVTVASAISAAIPAGGDVQAIAVHLFTGMFFRKVDDSQVVACMTGVANQIWVSATLGGTGGPANSTISAFFFASQAYLNRGLGPGWLDATLTMPLSLNASGTNVEMTLRRFQVRVLE
jgi:hypothetical protein